MVLSERHIIRKSSPYYKELDHLCFLSKNLFNASLYSVRQHYFSTKEYLNKYRLINEFTQTKNTDYTALPRKVSQQVLFQVDQSFKSFFSLLKMKQEGKYDKKIKLPYYKEKDGRNILVYTRQAISGKKLKEGIVQLSGTDIEIPVKHLDIRQVRVIPRKRYMVIEILHEAEEKSGDNLDSSSYASVDLGVNNLATIVSNGVFRPFIINGRPLKSMNRYYNKKLALLKSEQDKSKDKNRNKTKILKLNFKRNNKINDYMHKASRTVVNQLVSSRVSTLIIGYNKEWKQEAAMSRKNNQNFVQIPHQKFIEMIRYKCQLEGIKVILQEESYTSKCSFIDSETIGKHEIYKGTRIKRGLFRTADGHLINADVNGSLNILRKAVPNAFDFLNVKRYGLQVCSTPVVLRTMK